MSEDDETLDCAENFSEDQDVCGCGCWRSEHDYFGCFYCEDCDDFQYDDEATLLENVAREALHE